MQRGEKYCTDQMQEEKTRSQTHQDTTGIYVFSPIESPIIKDPAVELTGSEREASSVTTGIIHQSHERQSPTLDCLSRDDEVVYVKNQWKIGSIRPNSVDMGMAARPESFELEVHDLLEAVGALTLLASVDSNDCRKLIREDDTKDGTVRADPDHPPQLSRLYQNIHRMHSLIHNLTIENDAQTADLMRLHSEIQTKDERITKLELALKKLQERNQNLNHRSKSDRRRTRKLLEHYQDLVAAGHKKDHDLLVLQLQHHEQILLRERHGSTTSGDIPSFSLDGDSLTSIDDSMSSVAPTVYDDGIATLRLSRVRTATWPPLETGSESHHALGAIPTASEYSLFGTPEDFSNPMLDIDQNKKNQHHSSNSSTTQPVQSYTLDLLQPFELQFVALSVMGPTGEPQRVFAVCGYYGFDTALNVNPTLGASLLQINKGDLNSDWTTSELEQYIRDLGPRATMTFRNDNWSNDQKETLQKAIQEKERSHGERGPAMQAPAFLNPFARNRARSEPSVQSLRTQNVLNFLKLPGKPNSLDSGHRDTSEATAKTSGSKGDIANEEKKYVSSSSRDQINETSNSEDLRSAKEDDDIVQSNDALLGNVTVDQDKQFGKAMLDRPSHTADEENPVDAAGEMIISSIKHIGKLFHFKQ